MYAPKSYGALTGQTGMLSLGLGLRANEHV